MNFFNNLIPYPTKEIVDFMFKTFIPGLFEAEILEDSMKTKEKENSSSNKRENPIDDSTTYNTIINNSNLDNSNKPVINITSLKASLDKHYYFEINQRINLNVEVVNEYFLSNANLNVSKVSFNYMKFDFPRNYLTQPFTIIISGIDVEVYFKDKAKEYNQYFMTKPKENFLNGTINKAMSNFRLELNDIKIKVVEIKNNNSNNIKNSTEEICEMYIERVRYNFDLDNSKASGLENSKSTIKDHTTEKINDSNKITDNKSNINNINLTTSKEELGKTNKEQNTTNNENGDRDDHFTNYSQDKLNYLILQAKEIGHNPIFKELITYTKKKYKLQKSNSKQNNFLFIIGNHINIFNIKVNLSGSSDSRDKNFSILEIPCLDIIINLREKQFYSFDCYCEYVEYSYNSFQLLRNKLLFIEMYGIRAPMWLLDKQIDAFLFSFYCCLCKINVSQFWYKDIFLSGISCESSIEDGIVGFVYEIFDSDDGIQITSDRRNSKKTNNSCITNKNINNNDNNDSLNSSNINNYSIHFQYSNFSYILSINKLKIKLTTLELLYTLYNYYLHDIFDKNNNIDYSISMPDILSKILQFCKYSCFQSNESEKNKDNSQFSSQFSYLDYNFSIIIKELLFDFSLVGDIDKERYLKNHHYENDSYTNDSGSSGFISEYDVLFFMLKEYSIVYNNISNCSFNINSEGIYNGNRKDNESKNSNGKDRNSYVYGESNVINNLFVVNYLRKEIEIIFSYIRHYIDFNNIENIENNENNKEFRLVCYINMIYLNNTNNYERFYNSRFMTSNNSTSYNFIDDNTINKKVKINFSDKEEDLIDNNKANTKNNDNDNKAPFRIRGNFYLDFDNTSVLINNKNKEDKINTIENTQLTPILVFTEENKERINNITKAQILSKINESLYTRINENKKSSNNSNNVIFNDDINKNYLFLNNINSTSSFKNYSNNLDITHKEYYKQVIKKKGTNAIKLNIEYFRNHINIEVKEVLRRLVRIKKNDEYNSEDSGYIKDSNNDHLFNSISKIRFENYNGISSMFEEEIKNSNNTTNIINSPNNKNTSYCSFDLIDLYKIILSTSYDESIFIYLNNDILLQMNCFMNAFKSINDKVKESSNEIIKIVSTQNSNNNIKNCNSFFNSELKDSKNYAESNNDILSINLKTLLLSDINISRIKILNTSSNNNIFKNNTDIPDNLSNTLPTYILNNTINLNSVIELSNLIVNSLVYNNKTFIDLYFNKINYYFLNDFSYMIFKQQQEYFTLFGSYNDNIKMFIYNLDNTRLVNHGNKTVKQLHRLNAFNSNAYYNATSISSNCSGSKYVSIKDNCFLNIEIKLYSSSNNNSDCCNFNNKYKNNRYIFVNSLDMSYVYCKDSLLLEKIYDSCFNHSNICNTNNILSKPKAKNDLNVIMYVKDTIVVFDPTIIKTLIVGITRYNEVMNMFEEFKLFICNNFDNKIQLNSISEIKKERDNGGNNDDVYLSSLVRLFMKENKEKLEKYTTSNTNTSNSNISNNNSMFEYENNSSNSLNVFLNFKNIIIDYVTAYNYSSNTDDINNINNSNSLCREEAIPTHKIRTVVYLPYFFISVKKNQKDSKEDILINIENLTINILKDLTYPIEFNYLHKLEIRSKDILNESSFLTKLGFKEFLNMSYFYIKVKRFYNHYNSNLEMFCNSINVKCTKDLLICGVRVIERLGILKTCLNNFIEEEMTRINGMFRKVKQYFDKNSKDKDYANENDKIEKEYAKIYGSLFGNSRTFEDIFRIKSNHQNNDSNNITNNKDLLKTIENLTNNSNYYNNTSSRYSLLPNNQLHNPHFFFVDNYNYRNNNPLYYALSSKYNVKYYIKETYCSKLLKELILQEKISMDNNDVMLNALIMFHTIKITLYSGKDFCFVNKYIKNNSKFDQRKLNNNNFKTIDNNIEVGINKKNKKICKLANKTSMDTCNLNYKIRKHGDQKVNAIPEVDEKKNSSYNSIPNDTINVDDDIHDDFISHSTVVLPDKKNYLFDTHSEMSKTLIDKSSISNNKVCNKDYKKTKNIMSNIIDDVLIVKQKNNNDHYQKQSKYINGNNTYGSTIFDPNINIKSNNNNDKINTLSNNNNIRKSSLDSETNFTILILKDYFNQSEEETNQTKQSNILNPELIKSDITNDNQNCYKNNNYQLPINTLAYKSNKDNEEINSVNQTSLFSHQRNQTAILSEAFEALNSEQTLALNESLLKINNNNSLVNIIEAREKYETRNESKFIEININNIISEFSFFNYNYFKIIFEIKTCNVIDSVSNYYNFIIEQQKSKFVKIETVVDRINKEIDFNLRLSNVSINFDYSVINFLNDFFLVKEEMGRSFVFESYFKLIMSGNDGNRKINKRDDISKYNGNKYDDKININDAKNGEDEINIEVKQDSLNNNNNNDINNINIEDDDEEENDYEVLEILDNNNHSKNNSNADNYQLSNEIQSIEQSYSKDKNKLNQDNGDEFTSSKPSKQTQEIISIKETSTSYYKETPIKINNFLIKDFQVTLSFNKPEEYKDITLLPSFNKISILIKGFNLQDIINKEIKKASKPKFNKINNKLDKSKTMMLPNYNTRENFYTLDNNIYLNRLIKEIYYHWKEDLLNNQLIQAYLSTFKLIKPFSKIITKGVRLFLKPKVAENYDDSMYLDKFKNTILPIFYALVIGLQSKQNNSKKEYDCNFDINKSNNKDM